ncbi:MAG: hypothetical protein KDC53_03305, partial [Saprospiraceae bacterium]|nr:hypothetical protein [Saprospiraceae bacterium]
DANGVIEMTAGTVIVHGPTSSNNGAIDYDISFTITGGTLVAVGSSRMAQAPGSTSSQNSILVGFGSTGSSSQMIHIEDENGSDVLTFQPGKSYQALTFSSPALVQGKTYSILLGGSSDGTSMDGFYKEGEYAGGTIFRNFEISGITTVIQ